jgi:uncharacterized membrane protein YoaK (UPF0700 family)
MAGREGHVGIAAWIVMGVQNIALQTMDDVRLGETFITGRLVSLRDALDQILPWGSLATGLLRPAQTRTPNSCP